MATVSALCAATLILGAALIAGIDVHKVSVWVVENLEPHWLDDIVFAVALVLIGLFIDGRRREQRAAILANVQTQRLRVLKATMRTVQDIVNNFLTTAQLVELEAGHALSPETLHLLEITTRETAQKLTALGDLESTPEVEMAAGTGIAYGARR